MTGIEMTPNLSPKLLQRLQAEVGELCVANAALDILNQELIEQLETARAQTQQIANQLQAEARRTAALSGELDHLRARIEALSGAESGDEGTSVTTD